MGKFGGRHAADRKAVTLVHIGHHDHVTDQARQCGRVDGLVERFIAHDLLEQFARGEQSYRHAHVTAYVRWDFPFIIGNFDQVFDVHACLTDRASRERSTL